LKQSPTPTDSYKKILLDLQFSAAEMRKYFIAFLEYFFDSIENQTNLEANQTRFDTVNFARVFVEQQDAFSAMSIYL